MGMISRACDFSVRSTALWVLLLGFPCYGIHASVGQREECRKEELRKLIAVIQDSGLRESNPERVVQAILRLGDMKAAEAVGDLVGLITFRRWAPWEKDPSQPKIEEASDMQRYPAISALRQIGEPSVPALIDLIAGHDPSSLEFQNAMEVLIVISRYRRPAYVQKLRDAAAGASSPEAAERLRKAGETLEKVKR